LRNDKYEVKHKVNGARVNVEFDTSDKTDSTLKFTVDGKSFVARYPNEAQDIIIRELENKNLKQFDLVVDKLDTDSDEEILNEGPGAVLGDLAGKAVGDAWKGVKNFAKGVKDTAKDVAKTTKSIAKSASNDWKQSKTRAKVVDATRAIKDAENVDDFKAKYNARQDGRKLSDKARSQSYNGKIGKTIGDMQDWKFEVNGKKMTYDQFMKMPEKNREHMIKNNTVKCYDLMGRPITVQDQAKRLSGLKLEKLLLREFVGKKKTFSQWFDETVSDNREQFYPFANYIKTFPNAEVLANATAEDIRNNAHQFYDVYDVDSADREQAFHFASEELDMDYDDFYYAWLRETPIVTESLNEDWTHFEFKSGSNPYIAKDEREKNRILKKYGNKAKEIKPNYYMVDDSEGDRDFFKVDESVEELSVGDKFEAKLPSGNLETFTVNKVLPDAYQVKERTKDGDMIYKVNKNQVTRKIDGDLAEAFSPNESGVQSVKVYNQYNYTIQELRIDNDAKSFERGNFTMGKPDKKFKNRQQYEDLVDQLKELGYTEISSDYQSLRNKSRKGVPTNEGYELLNGTKVECYSDYKVASIRARKLGLVESEYGDLPGGYSFCT
jgi:hypothetical protein